MKALRNSRRKMKQTRLYFSRIERKQNNKEIPTKFSKNLLEAKIEDILEISNRNKIIQKYY